MRRPNLALLALALTGACLATAIAFAQAGSAPTGTVTLSWILPTTNTDGSPLGASQLPLSYTVLRAAGANCSTAPAAGSFTALAGGNVSALTLVDAAAPIGADWYEVVANGADGGADSSMPTNPVCATITAPPKVVSPPGGLTVTPTSQVAYKVTSSSGALAMVAVGTVAAGTSCNTSQAVITGGRTYYPVPASSVTFSAGNTGTAQPSDVFASCGG